MHFDMMNGDSVNGHRNMMQLMNSAQCWFHWDSVMSDAKHRSWHATGMKGWNGSSWITIPGVSWTGNIGTFATPQLYSAVAFVGSPATATGMVDMQTTPEGFSLYQNYPNPFNPSTTITFAIPQLAVVSLDVYNLLGQRVASLISKSLSAGVYEIAWNAGNLPSGVYFYRLEAGSVVQAKQLVLAR